MTYAYSVILNPEHSGNCNAVLGPAADHYPDGEPGHPGTWPPFLTVLNDLGGQGWRFHSRIQAEPHWREPGTGTVLDTDPMVWGIFLEKETP